ncbi:hypothetical protein R83H12_02413 [Fibrobacteria bacterium R8-3-H12]
MRNKLYKISTAILVLAIAFTLSIIACGGDKGTNSDPEDPSSSSVGDVNPSSSSEAELSSSSAGNNCPTNAEMTRAEADECVADALEKCVIENLIDKELITL